jgi:putative transposase
MIGRDYKPNFIGAYFHAYNRGVNKAPIFLDDQDYLNFLYRAKVLLGHEPLPKRSRKGSIRLKVLPLHAVDVLCYCLMPNHFHFLARQNNVDGLKMFLHRLCTSYSSYFNKKYNQVGHVFQGIYKSKVVMEDNYLIQLTGYIHFNPAKPFVWKYSSLSAYLGEATDKLSDPKIFFDMCSLTPEKYKEFLDRNYNEGCLSSAQILFKEG